VCSSDLARALRGNGSIPPKPLTRDAQPLLSERGRPRPPPSNRTPALCTADARRKRGLVIDGGGRGRPRSDRRASLFAVRGLLSEEGFQLIHLTAPAFTSRLTKWKQVHGSEVLMTERGVTRISELLFMAEPRLVRAVSGWQILLGGSGPANTC